MSPHLAVFVALVQATLAFQAGIAAMRGARPAVASVQPMIGVESVRVGGGAVMNVDKSGPPDPLELDVIWMAINIVFWGALLIKSNGGF